MDNIGKSYTLLISILAVVMNALTAAFAYSFIGELGLSSGTRFLVGLPVMWSPLFTLAAVIALWRKEKAHSKE